ncbi:MAG: rubrerythrin family protein, partial [Bacteroidota bacterium]
MKFRYVLSSFVVLTFVLAAFVLPGALAATSAPPGETLKNLQAAYQGESDAEARYLAFAEKADQEKQGAAASLFRAAARAEGFHAKNHAAVIRKLGGEPVEATHQIDVKSTKENLAAAVKGESYERDVMYPEFIEKAKAEKQKDAL